MRIIAVATLACLGCGSAARPAPQSMAEPETATEPAPPPAAAAPSDTGGQESHGAAEHAGHAAAGPVISLASLAAGAQLFTNLGDHHYAISTKSPEAQAYFDQGLRLNYGFNHDEAARSFAKAAAIDPTCAICYWGAALTLGPNYNVPMLPDRAAAAWDALQKARAQSEHASPAERSLIDALGKRYKGPEPLDPPAMQPLQEAYAAAMRDVARMNPDDADIQVLFAESLMDTNPWKLWSLDGKPSAITPEIVTTLEKVMKRNPKHPGANHYYIHAIEASPEPGRAEAAADRLVDAMPGAGHLVHMPAHIYQRIGRYADAAERNRLAAKADLAYIEAAKPFGYYPMYLAHNLGFLAFATAMEGRSAEAMQAAHESAKQMPKELVCNMPGMDFFAAVPYSVEVRFAQWEAALAEPRPDAKYLLQNALWLHARGMAFASTSRIDEAKAALSELQTLGTQAPAELAGGFSPARDLIAVAAKIVEARIAEKEARPEALGLWADAVAMADKLPYDEPADWFYPVRHYHGAALLAAGRAKEAEKVYREDLRRNPKNGWALFGLAQALRLEKKTAEAKKVEKRFKDAWKNADIDLTSSAL